MALIKVSQLPSATELNMGGVDHLMIIQSGINKKLLFSDLFKSIKNDVVINPDLGTINLTVNGQGNANLLKVDAFSNKIGINILNPDELLHCNGNLKIGGSNSGGVLVVSDDELIIPTSPLTIVSINNSFYITNITAITNSVSLQTIDLGDGKPQQMKMITFSKAVADRAVGMNYIVEGNFHGFDQLKFTKIGDSVSLIFINDAWALMGYNGVTVI
jgi:hypothetical protein